MHAPSIVKYKFDFVGLFKIPGVKTIVLIFLFAGCLISCIDQNRNGELTEHEKDSIADRKEARINAIMKEMGDGINFLPSLVFSPAILAQDRSHRIDI